MLRAVSRCRFRRWPKRPTAWRTATSRSPVEVVAEDELAALVKSFNQMAAQLAENRERLERAAEDFSRTNLALDNRRRYIETVLESLSTGVISTDAEMGIATINVAALLMLGLKEKPEIGTPINQLIDGQQGEEFAALCRRARRSDDGARGDRIQTGGRQHSTHGDDCHRASQF